MAESLPSAASAERDVVVPGGLGLPLRELRGSMLAHQRRLPLAVLCAGLLITAAIGEQTRRMGQQAHERIERALLDDVADAIEVKLRDDIATINGVAGLFNASSTVERKEFRRYVDTLRREEGDLDGIQGIGFSRFVPAARWAQITAGVRAEGFRSFEIRPAGPRTYGSAIVYLEPFDLRNQRAFGFDMYSEPTRRLAMDRAATTGLPSMSGRVRLVQERNTEVQPGVLVYAPVYRQDITTAPQSPRDYAETLVGWAYSPIRVGNLVKAALSTVNNPDMLDSGVLVHDGPTPSGETLLFDNNNLNASGTLTHPQYQPINVAGRTWLIGIQLSRKLIGPSGLSPQVGLVLALGTLTTFIASLLTALQVSNHQTTRQALTVAERANQERALAATVFEASPQAIVVTDAKGRVLSANQSFARITGYAGAEILGRSLNLLKSGRHDDSFYRQLWNEVQERGFWQGEIWNRLRGGEIRRHELSISAVHDSELQITQFVGMLQDITERHTAQEQIRHQALHDQLTGLPTRALLIERINLALGEAHQCGGHAALLFVDLNGFKQVNDRHGHAMGDRVLKLVAARLRAAIRDEDMVARLGGDEFVVLVPRAGTIESLRELAQKVQAVIRSCPEKFDIPIAIDGSIGIARSPDHGISSSQLLAAADGAMYRAKQSGDGVIMVGQQQGRGSAATGTEPIESGTAAGP